MPKNYSDCKGDYHLALFHLEDAKAALLDGGGREVKVFERRKEYPQDFACFYARLYSALEGAGALQACLR
jgi:hypothetical protein